MQRKQKMSLKHTILENLNDPAKVDFEVLLLTSLLIERYHSGSVKETDAAVDKDFDMGPPSKKDLTAVVERLIAFIETSPPPLLLQQTITTLGRCREDRIRGIVRSLLAKYLEQMLEINTVVYASMVALDECGAEIFSRNSFGLSEFDLNIADASEYIKNNASTAKKSDTLKNQD